MASRSARSSLVLCTTDGLFAVPYLTISQAGNVFLTALVTRAFPLPLFAIGVFSAVPFAANFAQVFAMPALVRWRPAKTLVVLAAGLNLAAWASFGVLLPLIPRNDPALAGRWIIGGFAVSNLLGAVAGVAWSSWIQEWVPARLRGKYFGWRNRLIQGATLLFILAIGWTLGRWDYAIPAFQVLIGVAVAARLVSLRCIWLTPTRPAPTVKLPWRHQWDVLRNSSSLLTFVAFGCVWSCATLFFGPFYQVFMFNQMRMSAFEVGLTATLAQLGGVLSLPAWGRLLDRYGNKPVMVVSLVLWQVSTFGWCFMEPGRRGILFALWIWTGATSAGFVLGQFTILLRLVPPAAKDLAIGFNLAVTSLFAALAPMAGGYLLGRGLVGAGDGLAVYHLAFLVQPVLALAGAFLLLRVREPAASRLSVVVGAMRNIRTLSGLLGLNFLTSYVFLRPAHRRRGP